MKIGGSLFKLSVFAVVTLVLTAVLASTIGNFRFVPTRTYKAEFTDVTGLIPGNDVKIAGVQVGQVKGIKVSGKNAQVTFSVDKDVTVRRSVQARIRYQNLVGQRYVSLSEATGNAEILPEGATIPVSQTAPALDLTVLFDGFKPLFQGLTPNDVNQLTSEIIATLQGEGGSVDQLLVHTASITNTIADRDAVVGQLIDNLDSVLATVDKRDNTLDQLIVQLQRFVSGLAADRQTIGNSLGNINDLATATASLLDEARPPLTPDIARLGSLAGQLNTDKGKLDSILQTLPHTLNDAIRTASFGSWFNFYLCDLDGEILMPNNQTLKTPGVHNGNAACNGD
jgi:phospholipid/cholesterol/gamma-HCH transport system substrate-binding protein